MENKSYYDVERLMEIRENAAKLRKKFLRYKEAEIILHDVYLRTYH